MNMQFNLDGYWGPVRLFSEVGLADPRQVRDWCMGVGLLRSESTCHRHRKSRVLRQRSDCDGYYWYCGKCDQQVSITDRSIFEDANIPVAKVLMLPLSYAHGDTYVSASRNCIFTREDGLLPDRITARSFKCSSVVVAEKCPGSDLEHGGMVGGPGYQLMD